MPSTPSYMDSANLFLAGLAMAETTEKALKALDDMEKEAKEIPAAKTILGLAYLLEGKPWYDFKRGFQAIKDAAEGNEPFCWFILGSLYLNGKPELPKDPVSAKYWIDKAAEVGYQDAVVIQELQWGDNPEGFVGWLAERLEKENKWRRWIGIGLIGLVVIAAIILFYV
jgi:TPR repeat protein